MINRKIRFLILAQFANLNFANQNSSPNVYVHNLGVEQIKEQSIKIAVIEISRETSSSKISSIIQELSKPEPFFDGVIFLPGSYSGFLHYKSPLLHLQDDIKSISIPKICYILGPIYFISYYIHSGCDEIWSFEFGQFERPNNSTRFPKNALSEKKYFEVPRVYQGGKHKVPSFENIELSDMNRVYLENLVKQDLMSRIKVIMENRKIGAAEINNWLNASWLTTSQALELKLIDKAGSYIAAKQRLVEIIRQTKQLPENIKVVEIYIDTRKEKRELEKNKNL